MSNIQENKHILLTLATRRPYSSSPGILPEAVYDDQRGCWILFGQAIAESENGPLTTKKCDQETGEDQKGE